MQTLQQAMIVVTWAKTGVMEFIDVQFNPTQLSFNKGVQIADIPIPGLDTPLLQFVRGQNESLSLDLFFDSTESGMGANAKSVTEYSDQIYQLVKIEPDSHAPPICEFIWNNKFPGANIAQELGNQKRNSFKCIVESVRHQYTLFSPEGVPLRATLSVNLREYKTLDDQLKQLNLNSPDRTQVQVLQSGDTLSSIAGQHYRRPGEWRLIADANNINDPRRLTPGTFVTVPPMG